MDLYKFLSRDVFLFFAYYICIYIYIYGRPPPPCTYPFWRFLVFRSLGCRSTRPQSLRIAKGQIVAANNQTNNIKKNKPKKTKLQNFLDYRFFQKNRVFVFFLIFWFVFVGFFWFVFFFGLVFLVDYFWFLVFFMCL